MLSVKDIFILYAEAVSSLVNKAAHSRRITFQFDS
jgi:hypothetical protein